MLMYFWQYRITIRQEVSAIMHSTGQERTLVAHRFLHQPEWQWQQHYLTNGQKCLQKPIYGQYICLSIFDSTEIQTDRLRYLQKPIYGQYICLCIFNSTEIQTDRLRYLQKPIYGQYICLCIFNSTEIQTDRLRYLQKPIYGQYICLCILIITELQTDRQRTVKRDTDIIIHLSSRRWLAPVHEMRTMVMIRVWRSASAPAKILWVEV